MYEFETFVYLDVQKTGSRFIVRLLRKHAAEKELFGRAHIPVGKRYNPGKFHFISVRHPLQQYISLYSYGCQNKGSLYTTLGRHNREALYDGSWRGFKSWLDFVLDAENAHLLDRAYNRAGKGKVPALLGFQSFRFLNMAVAEAQRLTAGCTTTSSLTAAYHAKKIAVFVVRHESFRNDLISLVRERLSGSMQNADRAVRYIETAEPRNTSERVDALKENPQIGKRRTALLEEREWLLHELFGY